MTDCRMWSPGVGGGGTCTLIFSSYVGLDPASTVYPINISGISGIPPKIFEISATPKIFPFCTLTL